MSDSALQLRGVTMRNLDEVLREKEMALLRVRQEIEALQVVAPMLMERMEPVGPELARSEPASKNRWPLEVDAPPQSFLG